jgi:Spy/CpxP family protein refolding chaperone
MKPSLPFILLSCMVALPIQAQTGTNSPTNNPPPPMDNHGGPMANLSPQEKQQLKAAHDKAIAADPTLDQKMKAAHEAMDAARQAMHDAILKADPSVGPILDKMTPKKWGDGNRPDGKHKDWGTNTPSTNAPAMQSLLNRDGQGKPPGFANLTPEEKAQLKAAHEKAKDDPAVVAAKAAEQSATTPEARKDAREAIHKAMSDAMLKAEPSIAPILEKIHPTGGSEGEGAAMPPPPQ